MAVCIWLARHSHQTVVTTNHIAAPNLACCLAMQVHSIPRDAFFGMSDNSNSADGLSYYLYPPPAYNSVEAAGEPQT